MVRALRARSCDHVLFYSGYTFEALRRRAEREPVRVEKSRRRLGSCAGDDRVLVAPRQRPPRGRPGPGRPGGGEPPPAPPARRPQSPDAPPPAAPRPRQAPPAARPPPPARLAPAPRPGPARDGAPVAPPRLAPVLALAVARSDGLPPRQRRGPRPDRADGTGESHAGRPVLATPAIRRRWTGRRAGDHRRRTGGVESGAPSRRPRTGPGSTIPTPEKFTRVCPPARPRPPPRPHRDRRSPRSAPALGPAGDHRLTGPRHGRGPGAHPVPTRRRERALTATTHHPRPHVQATPSVSRRPAVASPAREPGAVLAPGVADRPARDAAPLAPGGLPARLAVAIRSAAPSAGHRAGHDHAHPADGLREPALGCRAHPGRAPQARTAGQQADHPEVHARRAAAASHRAVLGDLPAHRRSSHLGV